MIVSRVTTVIKFYKCAVVKRTKHKNKYYNEVNLLKKIEINKHLEDLSLGVSILTLTENVY